MRKRIGIILLSVCMLVVSASPAQAHFGFARQLCSRDFSRGDWLQHWAGHDWTHRAVKLSGRHTIAGGVYVSTEHQRVKYNDAHNRVVRRVFVRTDEQFCWPA